MDSTIARLSSWMPLLRMRSPPCWKPFSTAMPMPSTVAPAFGQLQQTQQGAAVGQEVVDDENVVLGVRNFLETMTL